MKNIKAIPLHADMGPKVLEFLSRKGEEFAPQQIYAGIADEESSEAFVAGQSVASAISDLFGAGAGVYNDIDVFLMSDVLESDPNKQKRRNRLATLDFEAVEIARGNYGGLYVDELSVYAVHSTARQGLVNTVLTRPLVDFREHADLRARQFLGSFDLNCVQVGVRLSDQKLVWTPEYEQFLATRQLLVMNPKTPLHTAVRYLRKKRELEGVYGNDDHVMELLTAANLRIRKWLRDENLGRALKREAEAQLSFGTVYADKARELGAELRKWFDIEQTSDGPVKLFTLQPTSTPDARLLNADVPALLLPTYARALHGHWKKHVCASVIQCVEAKPERYPRIAVYAGGVDAVATQEKQQDVKRLDKLLREHTSLGPWLSLVPLQAHGALMRAILSAKDRHGAWVFGVFETRWPEDEEVLRRLREEPESVERLVGEWVDETIVYFDRLVRSGKHNHRPIMAPVDYAGFRFEELSTLQQLAEEGVRQCHCVAGYIGAVLEGRTNVVSMRKHRSQDSLTLQLSRWTGGFHVVQLRGIQNRRPTKEEVAIAERLALAATVYSMLAKVGIRLGSRQFAALLASDALLRKVKAFQENRRKLADKTLSWRSPTAWNRKAKEWLIRRTNTKCLQGQWLSFIDRRGTHHQSFLVDTPWWKVVKFLVMAAGLKAPTTVAANGFDEVDDELPF